MHGHMNVKFYSMLLGNTGPSIIGDKHSDSQNWQQFPRAADFRLMTCAFLGMWEAVGV